MSNFYTKTAYYSIATAAALTLVTAAPAFAAKRNAYDATRFYYAQPTTSTTDQKASATPPPDNSSSSSSTAISTDSAASSSSTTTPVASTEPVAASPSPITSTLKAIGVAVSSAKAKFFAKPVATSSATTTSGAIASTGIASLFEGSAISGSMYASDKFDQSDTYKLLALALALAAAGIFLTNTNILSRTYKELADVVAVGRRSPQPGHISRFRA